jgi:purine nucleoside permease
MKLTRAIAVFAIIFVATSFVVRAGPNLDNDGGKRPVKVLIVSMFEVPGPFAGEAQLWITRYNLTESIPVAGLPAAYPAVLCNAENICLITTDIGYANASTAITALMFSGQFNFSQTYVLVAGIAGVDPLNGSTGSVAVADWVVDSSLAHEIDAREMPAGWTTGYFGFGRPGAVEPGIKPNRIIGTEVYQLNGGLVQKILDLSAGVELMDNAVAQAYRSHYTFAPANQPPRVMKCASMSQNTWRQGNLLSAQANQWVSLWTDGAGDYCMTNEEDAATMTSLKRAANGGLLDFSRVAVLRSASDYDGQIEGFNDAFSALQSGLGAPGYPNQGGFVPAVNNLVRVGGPLVDAIVGDWGHWKDGIPAGPAPLAVKSK